MVFRSFKFVSVCVDLVKPLKRKKEWRCKKLMQKVLQKLSELSLSVGIGVCLSNQMSFFLQNNQLALLLSSSCSPPISTCRLTQALPVLKDQLSDLQTQPSLRTERWLWWKWLLESLTLAIIRWHCIDWNINWDFKDGDPNWAKKRKSEWLQFPGQKIRSV